MIFTPHIVVGATIGAKTQNLGLIIILAILFHIIMDKLPHWDYPVISDIKNFRKTKRFKFLFRLILKASTDIIIGLLIAFLALWNFDILNLLPFIILGIFFSVLPDIISSFVFFFGSNKLIEKHNKNFYKYFHCPEDKEKEGKITFLGLATQIIVIVICVFLLNL
jgi:uncharacterized protein YacL